MKKIALALIAVFVTGCTSIHKFEAAPQNYRLKGSDKQITISGRLDQKIVEGVLTTKMQSQLSVFINGVQHINAFLDESLGGEFTGLDYENKPVTASCSSKAITQQIAETRCIIFIDNERTATLTM